MGLRARALTTRAPQVHLHASVEWVGLRAPARWHTRRTRRIGLWAAARVLYSTAARVR